jgi:lysophospholipase L1-like esterase
MGHRKRAWKIVGVVAIVVVGVAVAAGAWLLSAMRSAEFWEPAIAAFEEQDAKQQPPPGAIVFTGSSSIRMWKSLEADMAPLPVLNRGFGGSHIAHVNQYTDRIVVPYAPRAVVLYAGDNDLAAGSDKTPASVLQDFQRFVSLAGVPVYFLAIKPSLARWDRWPLMRQANARIEAWADETERVVYVDVATPMLGADGEPRPELFIVDGLHMSAEGYALWTTVLKPVLLARAGPGAGS